MKDEALKLALEALKDVGVLTDREWQAVHKNKANELRQAIAELESQKPVAWLYEGEYSSGSYSGNYFAWNVTMNKNATNAARKVKPLYTAPPQRPLVDLTDADWKEIEDMPDAFDQGVAWCLARLKRKNT
jgi:hypothetical protein